MPNGLSEEEIAKYLENKKKYKSYSKDLSAIDAFKKAYLTSNPGSQFLPEKDITLSSGLTNRGIYVDKAGTPTQVGQFNLNPVDRPILKTELLNPLGNNIPQREPISPIFKPTNAPSVDSIPFNKFTAGHYGNPNAPYGEYIDEGKRVNVTKDEAQQMGFERSKGGKMKKFYQGGGNMFNYYNKQLEGDQQLATSILGTVGGLAGNIIAPGIGGEVGSMAGNLAGSLFADGGKMITQIPNSAGTHESNPNEGVNINNYDSSVEGNETIDNKNKFVFSNRLAPIGSKRSYASLTKPLNKKLDLRPDDRLTKDYVQMEMDKLAEDQEAQKEYMNIMNEAHKLYGGMLQMAKGGFMGINPKHKGYCTPMTKSTCTPHRKALAMTLKKHHGFHKKADGGDLIDGNIPALGDTIINNNPYKMLNGKALPIYNQAQLTNKTDNLADSLGNSNTNRMASINRLPYGYDSINMNTPIVPNNFMGKSPVIAPDASTLFPDVFKKAGGGFFKRKKKVDSNEAEIDAYKASRPWEFDENGNPLIAGDQSILRGTNPEGNFNKPINGNQLMTPIGVPSNQPINREIKQAPDLLPVSQEEGLTKPIAGNKGKRSLADYSQLLGPASQMFTSLLNKNKDLSNLNYRTPEFTPIDEFYAANMAKQTQDQQSAQIHDAIRGTANDPGSYLAAMLSANAGLLSAPSQPANLAYQANVANTAGRNQNAIMKAEIANKNIDERERLLDNSREEVTNSLYNAGIPITGLDRDNRQMDQFAKTNELFLKNMQTSGYTFDENGNIIPKRAYGGKMRKYKKC